MESLTNEELYCIAVMLHSTMRGNGFFSECRTCKLVGQCMPEGSPRPDMVFDRAREKLERLTGVNVGVWSFKTDDSHEAYSPEELRRSLHRQLRKNADDIRQELRESLSQTPREG